MSNIGQIVKSKYKLKEILGSGGMGVVYLAERIEIGDEVAIKCLNANHDYGALLKEAKANGILNHPNICKVYDFFEENSKQYLVLERLEGYDLAEILSFHKNRNILFPQDKAISVITKCLEALEYSHNLNKPNCQMILHRDIKPANIFLTCQGEVKILDFGIASFVSNDNSNNQTKSYSEQYSSPDLWNNQKYESDKFDPSNDLYSLGLVFIEMITNKKVFNSTEEVIKGNVFDINIYLKTIPRFKSFIEKWLSKSKSKRFQTATEILEYIREFENSELNTDNEVKEIIRGIKNHKEIVDTIKNQPQVKKKSTTRINPLVFIFNSNFFITVAVSVLIYVGYTYVEYNQYEAKMLENKKFSNLEIKNFGVISLIPSLKNNERENIDPVVSSSDLNVEIVREDALTPKVSLEESLTKRNLATIDSAAPTNGHAQSVPISHDASIIKKRPGFDCKKATTNTEKMICADNDLSQLDSQLMSLYKIKLSQLVDVKEFKHSQLKWLETKRNKCSNISCLKNTYQVRLLEIDQIKE